MLELGCGFGRSLPILSELSKKVTAVDISAEMIRIAKKNVKAKNVDFLVSPSESLPFCDEKYNTVICFAAFDAMYQKEALSEINRISKKGSRVLITGKNDNYADDDKEAMLAELAARSKGHPNYFTNVKKLVKSMNNFGFIIEFERYFARRGDFGEMCSKEKMPDRFYEYLFILKKIGTCKVPKDTVIANHFSKTYTRKVSSFK